MDPRMEIVIDLLAELYDLPIEVITPEMFDSLKVVKYGSIKHGMSDFLTSDGATCSHKEMHSSMFRHLADSHSLNLQDKDSKLDPLLHLACRALMLYTRRRRNLIHSKDTA